MCIKLTFHKIKMHKIKANLQNLGEFSSALISYLKVCSFFITNLENTSVN